MLSTTGLCSLVEYNGKCSVVHTLPQLKGEEQQDTEGEGLAPWLQLHTNSWENFTREHGSLTCR